MVSVWLDRIDFRRACCGKLHTTTMFIYRSLDDYYNELWC